MIFGEQFFLVGLAKNDGGTWNNKAFKISIMSIFWFDLQLYRFSGHSEDALQSLRDYLRVAEVALSNCTVVCLTANPISHILNFVSVMSHNNLDKLRSSHRFLRVRSCLVVDGNAKMENPWCAKLLTISNSENFFNFISFTDFRYYNFFTTEICMSKICIQ